MKIIDTHCHVVAHTTGQNPKFTFGSPGSRQEAWA